MAAYIALICFLLPLVSAAVCYISPSGKARKRLGILFGSLQIMVAAILLLLVYINRNVAYVYLDFNLQHISFLVRFVNLGLLIVVLFKIVTVKPRRLVAAALAGVQILLLFVMEAFVLKKLGGTIVNLDLLAMITLAVTMLVGAAAVFISLIYYAGKPGQRNVHVPQIFLLLLLVNASILSSNLTWLHFFWQLSYFLLYLIFKRNIETPNSTKSNFLLNMNLLSGIFFVLGIMLIYKSNVTTLLTTIADKSIPQGVPWYFAYGLTFLIVATAIRAGFLPFTRFFSNTVEQNGKFPVYMLMFLSSLPGIFMIMRLAPIMEHTVMGKMVSAYASFVFAVTALALLFEHNANRRMFYSCIMTSALTVALTSLGSPLLYGLGMVLFVLNSIYLLLYRFTVLMTEQQGEKGRRFAQFSRMLLLPISSIGLLTIKWFAVETAAESYMTSVVLTLGFIFEAVYVAREIADEVRAGNLRFRFKELFTGFGKLKGTMYLLTFLYVGINLTLMLLLYLAILPYVRDVAFRSPTLVSVSWWGIWLNDAENFILGGGKIFLGYVVILAAGIITALVAGRKRGLLDQQPRPFLCGAGLPDDTGDKPRFIGPADIVSEASFDYFKMIKMPVYLDFAALLYILAMFGVLVR